jgi:hypothetical protein
MGKSTDREEQPLLKSEINTFTELSTPQITGKCERQERVWYKPPTVVVVLISVMPKKKGNVSISPRPVIAD